MAGIDVSVTPRQLTARRRARLNIRVANTGTGTCRRIVFTLGLPQGVSLVSGGDRVEIALLRPGDDHVHEVTVEPSSAGDYPLTSPNFAYRDEYGRPVRITSWSARLDVAAAPPAREEAALPAPRLQLECGGELGFEEWGILPVLIRNSSGVPVSDVWVTVSGPIETDGRRHRIALLRDGQRATATLSVKAVEPGLVPLTVRLSYSYADRPGSVGNTVQAEPFTVRVVKLKPGESVPAGERAVTGPGTAVTTVLFLSASPKDLEPLRPDQELRDVEEELRQVPNREAFRVVAHTAARLTDISRALMRYQPHIVHFSGHGGPDGRLYVEDEYGYGKPTNTDGLAELFGRQSATIRCVIVNACQSEQLAKAISGYIGYAIGMQAAIGDSAAVLFSRGFYQALFGGADVPAAFAFARSLLHSDEVTAGMHQIPVLYPSRLA